MKHPVIISIAAVAACAVLGGSAVAVTEVATSSHAQPVAAAKAPAPAPTKTIVKHKTVVVPAPAAAPAAPAVPAALRAVGSSGVMANSNTSDAFALNVASSFDGSPGTHLVYSPVTGQTYSMDYEFTSPGTVTATGGNGALVQFPY